MIRVGITGQEGFVGKHLYNTLNLLPDEFQLINFKRSYFDSESELSAFVAKCDCIVHLAAMNRHNDPQTIYQTNIGLVEKLINAIDKAGNKPHVLFSSSSQEERDNLYGKSKKEGRQIFVEWSKKHNVPFTGLVIPNVFGPFGKPFYNSFIGTFSHQLNHGETPTIEVDGQVKLIYVAKLVQEIIQEIRQPKHQETHSVAHEHEAKVTDVLTLLKSYQSVYLENGNIPKLESKFELDLFNTFRSYIDYNSYYPKHFKKHSDQRGDFVELIRLGEGGQVSFSTTVPGITRGNHFHTRKIERFAVIKGRAKIEFRKMDDSQVYSFELDGENPSYVDMPIWFTHNIQNIGDDILYTMFWINEPYDAADPDTYMLEV
jgi:UDP-2-acetamido-2,6-beta-L-arabino-hexul-4-ose reductase